MTEAEQHLIDVAILLAQELQEYVDVAIECAGSNPAELATQELLQDWEEAYKACGFHEEDHFRVERGMSPMLCTKDAQMTCIVHPTEASLKARIAELEKCNKHRQAIIEELERRLTPKQCGECHLKPAEICDICGAMGGGEK